MDRATYNVKDASFKETKALSNGAGSVNTDGFDLGANSAMGTRNLPMEAKVDLPALTTTELPDSETMSVKVQECDASDFTGATTLYDAVLVQTGAGGAGAAAANARYRIPTDCKRYIRLVVTKTGTGDCSGKSVTHQVLF